MNRSVVLAGGAVEAIASPSCWWTYRRDPGRTAARERICCSTCGRHTGPRNNVIAQDVGNTARYIHDRLRSEGGTSGHLTAYGSNIPVGVHGGHGQSPTMPTGAPTPGVTTSRLIR